MHLMPTLTLLAVAAPAPADLLQRLAAHDERSQALSRRVATRMTIVGEELDKKGNPTKRTETAVLLTFQGDREVATIVKSTEDGKDVTEEARKKQGNPKPEDDSSGSMKMKSPFSAAEQAKYVFEVIEADPSRMRLRFAPKGKPSPELWTGEAVVDPAAGEVVSMRSQPSKPPRFVDSMSMELELGARLQGTRMPSKVFFRGEGGFLFIRKRFRGSSELAYESPAGADGRGADR